jgi:hypothetical protein
MRIMLALSVLAQAACGTTAPSLPAARDPVRVSNGGQPFQMWEGAAARKVADAQCGPRGVRSSIYDRYDRAAGEWVYPGGCA